MAFVQPHGRHAGDDRTMYRSVSDEDSYMLYKGTTNNLATSTTVQQRRLKDQVYKRLGRAAFDICLAIIPCMFIYLAIAAKLLDGQTESDYGRRIQEVARIGPTVYPIAFAAIVARFMRHIARWQAQRGQSLGILEQLIQSSSLAATVETAFSLKAATLASLSIVSLWALSPIGGQGSLRVLSTRDNATVTPIELVAPFGETMRYFGGLSHYVTTPIVISALISVSLAAPNAITESPRDTWGNVKVPASHYVQAEGGEYTMAHQLVTTDGLLSNETDYSSLIGVPIWGVPQQGNLTFSFEWPLFDTDCQWTANYTDFEFCQTCYGGKDSCFVNNTLIYSVYGWPKGCNVSEFVGLNYTTLERCQLCDGGQNSCFTNSTVNGTVDGWPTKCQFGQSNLRFEPPGSEELNSTEPTYLNLGWYVYVPKTTKSGPYATGANCKLRTTHVTTDVFCADGVCEVFKMRKNLTDRRPDFLNPWNDPSNGYELWYKGGILDAFLEYLLQSTGFASYNNPTPLESWILGSTNPYDSSSLKSSASYGLEKNDASAWWSMSDADLSRRLTKLYNTMWLASQQSSDIPARVPGGGFLNATTGEILPDYRGITTTVTTTERVYSANNVWITLLIVISLILLLCALTSLTLRLLITAPDILGYVSSLTRDNIHFQAASLPVLHGGSIMSGSDRARAMHDMRVQIVDLHPEKDVGHVTVVPVDCHISENGQMLAGKVYRDRIYD